LKFYHKNLINPHTYCINYNKLLFLKKNNMKKIYLSLFLGLLQIVVAQTNVTFQVNMNQQSGFTTPEVNGTFNNWCGSACNPMTDANGDGIWETTIALAPGNYEYKFAADNWGTQETLLPGSPCTVTNFGFTNRTLTVGTTAVTLPAVCWGSCSACAGGSNALKITVDLCGQNAQGVRLTGAFWNWTWNAGPVASNNGNGTWSFTLNPPPAATMEYLILVDTIQENLIIEMQNGATCAPSTDYATYANRVWSPGNSDSVYIFYNKCASCASEITENQLQEIQIFPNPAIDKINFKGFEGDLKAEFYNSVGQLIIKTSITKINSEISLNAVPEGFYLLKLYTDKGNTQKRIVIAK
jgi:hypothetical protein